MSNRKQNHNIRVALDIGTTKVIALVAEFEGKNKINILNFGSYQSSGMSKGVVVNIEETIHAIKKTLEHAQLNSGIEIHEVIVSISGKHISSLNSNGAVSIKSKEVSKSDVERVLHNAKSVALPDDRVILHVLPQEFIIDSQTGIDHPIGMTGARLEAKVHIITGEASVISNVCKCVESCGVNISSIVLQPLASGHAVLSEDERNLGVCMVDIGGGTTDIAVFKNGSIVYTSVIPVAGNQVTNDIVFSIRVPFDQAESIKIQHGYALETLIEKNDFVEIHDDVKKETRRVSHSNLSKVIEARYEEIFTLVKKHLTDTGLMNSINSGLVITGGGSRINGLTYLAEEILNVPCRIGQPRNIKGHEELINNPAYSTVVGLLWFDMSKQEKSYQDIQNKNYHSFGMWKRFTNWISENF